ncbi:hypothetical protein ACFWP2_16460 [Kitasatospora sp. NPDC058444]|uniref:hypothetical protein n=1 Tax=Kitasatospora sp. NPDC058444 TaxID=3346504 RepID=UPI003647317A
MTRLSWLSRAAATVLLSLETVAVVFYFCMVVPLFYNGIGFEDEVAPRSKVVPHLMALGGFTMAGINGFAVRELWRPLPDGGRGLALATAGVQVVLLGYAALSGDYLFAVFAVAVLLMLGAVAASGHRSGAQRGERR